MTTETSTTDSRHRAWSMLAAPVEPAAPQDAGNRDGDGTNRSATAAARPRIVGLRCRNCQRAEVTGPYYVCPECFGPL